MAESATAKRQTHWSKIELTLLQQIDKRARSKIKGRYRYDDETVKAVCLECAERTGWMFNVKVVTTMGNQELKVITVGEFNE